MIYYGQSLCGADGLYLLLRSIRLAPLKSSPADLIQNFDLKVSIIRALRHSGQKSSVIQFRWSLHLGLADLGPLLVLTSRWTAGHNLCQPELHYIVFPTWRSWAQFAVKRATSIRPWHAEKEWETSNHWNLKFTRMLDISAPLRGFCSLRASWGEVHLLLEDFLLLLRTQPPLLGPWRLAPVIIGQLEEQILATILWVRGGWDFVQTTSKMDGGGEILDHTNSKSLDRYLK